MKSYLVGAVMCLVIPVQVANAADEYNDVSDLGTIEEQFINSQDPCTIFMCMAGKLYGENSRECDPAVSTFFSLKSYGRHGFDPGKTFKKREGKLDNCPSADGGIKSKILNAFGRLKG